MRFYAAAALALVGWYLVLHPFDEKGVRATADLSAWGIWDSYDTAAQCRAARHELQKKGEEALSDSPEPPPPIARSGNEASKFAQCVATDDPRLKQN
jgi:hypothetical protein